MTDTPPQQQASPSKQNDYAPPFFAVSIPKLVALSICTFNLYMVYWFYMNWRRIRTREQSRAIPFQRALFAPIFCYQTFKRIRDYPLHSQGNGMLAAGYCAIGWIVLALSGQLPFPYSLASLLAVLFMIPAQRAASRVNAEVSPEMDRNRRFSALNWFTVIIGGSVLLMAAVGVYLGPREI
jgi:hypothetical protein